MKQIKLQIVSLVRPTVNGCEPVEMWIPNVTIETSKISSILDTIERNHVCVDNGDYKCCALFGEGKAEEEINIVKNRIDKLKK